MASLPGHRVVYGHIAGHYNEAEDLRVDTHGADVIDQVWDLLDLAYKKFGVFPTLLERDFNIPLWISYCLKWSVFRLLSVSLPRICAVRTLILLQQQ